MHSPPRSSVARCSSTASCTAARTSSDWPSARWPELRRSVPSRPGFLVRRAGFRLVTLAGLGLAVVGPPHHVPAGTTDTDVTAVAGGLAVFGLGFGLSVTPRSAAAVEAAGQPGVRGRVIGRDGRPDDRHGGRTGDPHGLRFDDHRSTDPPDLRRRPRPPRRPARGAPGTGRCATRSSSGALEAWASREAASIMVGLFLVAAPGHDGRDPARGWRSADAHVRPRRGRSVRRVCCPLMAQRSPTSSSERTTGRAGEPMARRRPPTSSGAPGRIRVAVARRDRRARVGTEDGVGAGGACSATRSRRVGVDLDRAIAGPGRRDRPVRSASTRSWSRTSSRGTSGPSSRSRTASSTSSCSPSRTAIRTTSQRDRHRPRPQRAPDGPRVGMGPEGLASPARRSRADHGPRV